VNAVLPGAILTERQRQLWFTEEYKQEILSRQAIKRMILPEEVAKLILFLASDESLAITNQSFIIDGDGCRQALSLFDARFICFDGKTRYALERTRDDERSSCERRTSEQAQRTLDIGT